MAGLAVAAAVVCMTLPETYNQPTAENLAPADEADRNLIEKDGEVEKSTAIWAKRDVSASTAPLE